VLACKEAALLKRAKYAKYNIGPCILSFAFGRTNILSQEVLDFCAYTARHFPHHIEVNPKMRASFSRAICVRVARTFNLAVRRMQLSAAARVLLFLLLLCVLLMRLWLDGSPF
jgi:hypothetical protein